MKIYKSLNDPMSAILRDALIEVEPGEVADIEKMIALLDGDSVGHFGIRVELMSENEPPKIEYRKNHGGFTPVQQFGFSRYSVLKTYKRYYRALLNRD